VTPKTFSSTQPSIPFGCVNENNCGVKLRSISLQSYSTQLKARHYVLTTLGLDIAVESIPREYEISHHLNREGALCKLRNKYRAQKMKEVCQLVSNPLKCIKVHCRTNVCSCFVIIFKLYIFLLLLGGTESGEV
jgi:hypothetical protein